MSGGSLLVAAVLITVVPVLMYVWVLWRVDRYEKEPVSLLGASLVGGALVAPILTSLVEGAAGIPTSVFPALFQRYPMTPPNMGGAIVEELAKAAVVLAVYVILRGEFDNTLDGVVYGATVGAGFALAEAVVYLSDLVSVAGAANLTPGFFGDLFLSGLTHCVFSALFGAALGYVRETAPSRPARLVIPLVGLAAAVIYHVAYVAAGSAGLAGISGSAGLLIGLGRRVADVAGLLLLGLIVVWAWSRERNILRWALADEVGSGLLTADELSAVAQGRMPWERPLREALAEMAFAKWRLSRGLGTQAQVDRQRERVRQIRTVHAGSGR